MQSPWEHYQQDLQHGNLEPDAQQAQIIEQCQRRYDAYCHWQQRKHSTSMRWAGKLGLNRVIAKLKRLHLPQGLYVWGGVGIGKTYVMDIFYRALPGKRKSRLHFHQFMRQVHQELHALQGTPAPLAVIAQRYAQRIDVLCFDEFMVHEIADAMLLGGLLQHLLKAGVIIIATSNIAPDDLYENGLHRELFLPAIALIKQHCHVIHCQTSRDYRLARIKMHGVYFHPIDANSAQHMQTCFDELTSHMADTHTQLTINSHTLRVRGKSENVIWFDFNALCTLGRSKLEYLEIAKTYHTLLLSGIPKLAPAQTDKVTFFMQLVDILYDANVNVIIEAEGDIASIYAAGPLAGVFARTASRLHEMQSQHYIHAPHATHR